MARTTHTTAKQLHKLRDLARKHEDLTYATTGDGLIIARFLTAWIRDGYSAVIRGERHEIEARPDQEPICYVIGRDGTLAGYCKRKPENEREQALVGTPDNPLPTAARRLSFKPLDADSWQRDVEKARKREAA